MEQKKSNKKLILGGVLLVALIACFALVYSQFGPKSRGNSDLIHIQAEVVLTDGASTTFDIDTEEQFLRGALEQENLIQGSDSEYGMFVTTVNGVTANDANQEWWCFTKDGVSLDTGVDSTPIADGDHFEITLTVGY